MERKGAAMGGKGHYHGGGTSVGPRDRDWFREGSTKPLSSESAPVAPRSEREQAAFEAFKKEREKPTATLIKSDPRRPKSGRR